MGKDIEFAYFRFRVPHLWRAILKDPDNAPYEDTTGTLPDLWWNDIITLPVYGSVEFYEEDKIFIYFHCKVPLCLMKSPLGLGYFAPQMQFNNDMAPPTPDHEMAADRILKKMKHEPVHQGQWAVTFRCNALDEDGNVCGREETEIHNSATEGLVRRYCGKCGSTRLQLVGLDPIKKGDWCFRQE